MAGQQSSLLCQSAVRLVSGMMITRRAISSDSVLWLFRVCSAGVSVKDSQRLLGGHSLPQNVLREGNAIACTYIQLFPSICTLNLCDDNDDDRSIATRGSCGGALLSFQDIAE